MSRYCCYAYPHFSTARVIFRDHDHGRVAAQVKKTYLDMKNIRGSKALKSTFAVSMDVYSKQEAIRKLPTWKLWRSAWVYGEFLPIPWREPNLPLPHHMVRAGPIIWRPDCGKIGAVIGRSGSSSFHPGHIADVHSYQEPVPMEIDEEVINEDPVVIEHDDLSSDEDESRIDNVDDGAECAVSDISDLLEGIDLDKFEGRVLIRYRYP